MKVVSDYSKVGHVERPEVSPIGSITPDADGVYETTI